MATAFKDMTVYCHMIEPFRFENVFNVGWLDPRGQFAKGGMSVPPHEKLMDVAFGNGYRRSRSCSNRTGSMAPAARTLLLPVSVGLPLAANSPRDR